MAHIAIFCDGTWNSAQDKLKTHVLQLSEACAQTPMQRVLYFEGVGNGTGRNTALGRLASKYGGGLFGWGLNRNIRAAYLALCQVYKPGDKIMIFGFSRGAYTARSLVGMIRKCGILAEPTRFNTWRAFRLYRSRGARNAPDAARVLAKRRRLSPDFATSQADVETRADDSNLVRITYLGVWDTVGALGVPKRILGRFARRWNLRYEFHDTALTQLVEQARHAVALDERRVLFEPSLWDNLDQKSDDTGLNRGDQSDTRPYQQVWFAGDHAIVGGATEALGLSTITQAWIWDGAKSLGLRAEQGARLPRVPAEPGMITPELNDVRLVYRILPSLLAWREGPQSVSQLHDTVRLRVAQVASYRPGSLAHLMPALFVSR